MSKTLTDAGLFANLIAENRTLRKAIIDLMEINDRDERGDPDYLVTDQGRADAWEFANRAVALGASV